MGVLGRVFAFVLVALLAGCAGDDPKLDCSTISNGSWHAHGDKLSGDDCTPPTLDTITYLDGSTSGDATFCTVETNTTDDMCSIDTKRTCEIRETPDGALRLPNQAGYPTKGPVVGYAISTGTLTIQSETTVMGTLELDIEHSDGTSCRGVYDVTYTKL